MSYAKGAPAGAGTPRNPDGGMRVKYDRRKKRPPIDLSKFKKLPPRLQRAVESALRKEEEHTSLSDSPRPATPAPAPPPAVVFYSFDQFLMTCSLDTLDLMWGRYWSLDEPQRRIIRQRLKIPLELVGAWIRWGRERAARTEGRTGPAGPEENTS